MKSLLFLLIIISTKVQAQHQVDYRISALGNLVYQLDCLTQVARFRCSHQSFKQLWQSEISIDEKDTIMLNSWAELREEINKTLSLVEENKIKQPTSANYPQDATEKINLLEKARLLAMSSTKDEYLKVIGTLISLDYANKEAQIINHFQSRFDHWFALQKSGLATFINDANELGEKTKVSELLSSLRRFYQSEIPEIMTLPVYLIAHPQENAPTSGLVFAENSIIEVLKGEKAQNRLGVVIHEIAHFYHERAPRELHHLMMNHFVVNDSSTGKVGYYLFNEAIATAIGNGLVEERIKDKTYFEKYLNHPMSFYANEGIDSAAKSAFELVKTALENNQSIDQSFLNDLDQLWGKSLSPLKNKPKERFRHVGMILAHDSSNEILNHVFALIGPSSAHMNTVSDLRNPDELVINQFSHLDTIIIAESWEQIPQLKPEQISQQAGMKNYTEIVQLPNNTVMLMIVSPSKEYIKTQIEDILEQDTF